MAGRTTGSGARLWEEEFLAEWLATQRDVERSLTRVRLGPLNDLFPDPNLTDAERRLLGAAFRRWADAVLVRAGRLVIVEASMIPDPRDISLVQTYLLLVDHTQELELLHRLPRIGLLLWATDDPFSRVVARQAGIQVEIFKPSNFQEFLVAKRARETRPARTLTLTTDTSGGKT